MVSFQHHNNRMHNGRRTRWPGNYSRSYVDASRDKAGPFSTFYPSKRISGRCSTPSLVTPSKSTMHLESSEVESMTTRQSPYCTGSPTTWDNRGRSKARGRLKLGLKFRNASVPRFNKPLKLPFLAHTQFKTNVQKFLADLIRQHRHVLVPSSKPVEPPWATRSAPFCPRSPS